MPSEQLGFADLDVPRGFRGLVRSPQTEVEVVILTSMLLEELGAAVYRTGDHYPDWTLLVPNENGEWREILCEIEVRSSGFKQHLPIWNKNPDSCQLIVCWEYDSDPTEGSVPIVDLQSVFHGLTPERQMAICRGAFIRRKQNQVIRQQPNWLALKDSPMSLARRLPPPEFRGLAHLPTTETETIILMALLLARSSFCIELARDAFPDWIILEETATGWKRLAIEVECDLKNFQTHKKALVKDPACCHGVIAWEGHCSLTKNLKEVFVEKLLEQQYDRERFCFGLMEPDGPETHRLAQHLLEHLPNEAATTFAQLIDALGKLGFDPRNGPRRDGLSYQLAPKETVPSGTETFNLYCFKRGRYSRPTFWWSLSSLEKTLIPKEVLRRFKQQMLAISPSQHVTCGVHCTTAEFSQIVEPVLDLSRKARELLW